MQEFPLNNKSTQTAADSQFKEEIGAYFEDSSGSTLDKLNNFPRFVPRQALSSLLAKNDIFKKVLNIHGCIVECGVFMGGGLFSWSQLSSIHEPMNHNRKVIGFDTFSGFVGSSSADDSAGAEVGEVGKEPGTYCFDQPGELTQGAELFDLNRSIGHIPKIELVKGDATQTIPEYIESNRHLVVSLLYLDFDLYEPTKVALEHFLPRMPQGAVVVFDELNQKQWPGETQAVLETIGLNRLKIERFPTVPQLSYAVLA